MTLRKLTLGVLIPLAAGVLVATITARPSAAATLCECNICFTNTGNCDVTDFGISCAETESGCRSRDCTGSCPWT